MRNQLCRMTLLDHADRATGRGFVVDARRVITCVHVVRFCCGNQRDPRPGDEVRVRTDEGEVVSCKVVMAGGAPEWADVCCLERIDDGLFAEDGWAEWGPASPGQRFSGLGASAKVQTGVPIFGEIVAIGEGGDTLIVTTGNLDTRIEPGCSGAAVFALPDGPLLGMVATYQQERSGTLISARTIAEFCTSFRKAMPASAEGFGAFAPLSVPVVIPDVGQAAPPLPPLGPALADLDRKPQKMKLDFAISKHDLLGKCGIVISLLGGVDSDMPYLCAQALGQRAFQRILRRIAPDMAKSVHPMLCRMSDLLDDDVSFSVFNLQSLISEKLGVSGATIAELRRAVADMGIPISLVMEARPRDMARLSAPILLGWAKLLEDLARPRKYQPIALFILNVAPADALEIAALPEVPAIDAPYYVPLDVLPLISLDDVRFWARERFGSDDEAQGIRDRIDALIVAKAGGREQFRFGEIYKWLTQGQG